MKSNLQNKLWLIQGILIIILCAGWYQFGITIKNNDNCAEGLNYIEYLNSSTQRLVKLEMQNSPNDELVHHLNNVISKLDSEEIYGNSASVDVELTNTLISDLQHNWQSVFEEILQVREGENSAELLFASERFYNTAIQLTMETSKVFKDISERLYHIQMFLIGVIVLIASIIAVNILSIFKELKITKMLSEKMFVDILTGLYNRSKCQEMLKGTLTPANLKSRIMIMIDLNDLKKTNDKLGHQIGDELIANFAKILKDAAAVHNFEVFIGRYGGDEFMIYYPSADEADALLYIEEVEYLCDQYNLNEEKFVISFAAGYAVFGENRADGTMRDLFNEADANMYTNKVKAKEKRRAEFMHNEHELVTDDRLMPNNATNKGGK